MISVGWAMFMVISTFIVCFWCGYQAGHINGRRTELRHFKQRFDV